MARKIINEIGNKYGRLLVIAPMPYYNHGAKWKCICECQKEVIVRGDRLRSGKTRSCGCLRDDTTQKLAKERCGKLSSMYGIKGSLHPRYSKGGFSNKGELNPMYGKRGYLSPSWKGGLTPKNDIIRHSTKYKEWRKTVFERDNYTCQNCNKRGGNIHAHHIKQFATYPELRFDINNGITLCEKCHKKEHKKPSTS